MADPTQLIVYILFFVLAVAVIYLLIVVSIPLGKQLATASRTAATAFLSIADQFKHFGAEALRGTVIFAQAVKGTFSTILTSTKNAFEQSLQFSVETFARGLNAVDNIIFGSATQISGLGVTMLQTIGAAIGNLSVQAGRMVQDAITKLVLGVIGLISALIRFIIELVSTGIQSLLNLFNQIAAAISLAIDSSTSGALAAIDALNATAMQVLSFLSNSIEPVLSSALTVFNAIASIF